jgi:hypothetical protein
VQSPAGHRCGFREAGPPLRPPAPGGGLAPSVQFALPLSLILLLGCYPDADAIRHTVAVLPDAATDGPGGPGDAASAPDQAPLLPPGSAADNCTDLGLAWCEKSRRCGTLDYEDLGGDGVCAERMKLWCENLLAQPTDSNWAPATFMTCISSWSSMTCDDWTDVDLELLKGAGCAVPGKRADGAGCWSFSQCAGLRCARNAACGRCTSRIPAGGACKADSDCLVGLICGQDRCVAATDVGDACDDAHPCRRSLRCNGGTCDPRATAGQPCSTDQDCAGGLLCNFGRGTCGTAIASPTHCSRREADGSVVYCGGGKSCAPANQACVAPAADNAACVANGSPDCLWPAVCFNSKCIVPAPIDCPM